MEGNIGESPTGFLQNGKSFGRPVDILRKDKNSFFFTDDFGGVVYLFLMNNFAVMTFGLICRERKFFLSSL